METHYYTISEFGMPPVIEYLFIPNKAVIALGLSKGEFSNSYELNQRVDTNPKSLEIVQNKIKLLKKEKQKTIGSFTYNYISKIDIKEDLIEKIINLRETSNNLKKILEEVGAQKINYLEKLVKKKLNLA